MQLTFGKHTGKSLELVILKHPDYVVWMLGQQATGALKSAQQETKRLMTRFDSKPLVKHCLGKMGSKHLATYCTVYGSNVSTPYWWCNDCDPHQAGALQGKLQSVRSYQDALTHVEWRCGGRAADYKSLIKDLAQAKGLPSRVGEKQAADFFA